MLLAVLCGVAALLGAATVTATPWLFVAVGLGVFLAADHTAAAGLAARRAPAARRRAARWAMFASSSVLLVAVFAGYNVYQDRPAAVITAIVAFLNDRRLPRTPYQSAAPPPDYQGPADGS
ncbi:MAG TPA: hypothetical protein VHH34_02025 [Pseudonocardiaceae bacterium]|nr:hypothetical protein [Pseudonocardiaceae bacterium]